MKIAIVVGTRPEIIKMSPIINECKKRKIEFFLIHTNQHFSPEMDVVFFKELALPSPDYNLNIGKEGGHANQTGHILIKIEPIFEKEMPDLVLVQGDTNTVLAAALAATKLGIKLGHIEAGLRSYDKTMPEETNRVITDHISDFLFAVTSTQEKILVKEGIPNSKIYVVGNTIADALLQNLEKAEKESSILSDLNIKKKDYILFTAHRASNVDSKPSLTEVVEILNEINNKIGLPIVWPIHPRTQKKLDIFNLQLPPNTITTPPIGYLDFSKLLSNARLVITDSGGVQEEACILKTPCLTIRDNTERPETVAVGANILVGRKKSEIVSLIRDTNTNSGQWESPFGNGKSANAIINIIQNIPSKPTETYKQINRKKIAVIGLGYMGLPIACLLAKAGHDVLGVDISKEKINLLKSGKVPFHEPGLLELFNLARTANFRVSTELENAEAYIIAVPTPELNKKCDLKHVMEAAKSISQVAKNGQLVLLESTVKPNTCKNHLRPFFESCNLELEIAFTPERAFPGNTIYELTNNDRIVGGLTPSATQMAKEIYRSFVDGQIFTTTATCAESVKLFENTFRDVNIALANEFEEIARELSINIWEAIELANKHPRVNILNPGPGVGGHCIAVDPWFLVEDTKSGELVRYSRRINDEKPFLIVKRALELLGTKKRVGILGASFKKDVDDCRESPSITIYEELCKAGHEVSFHDPHVTNYKDYTFIQDIKEFDKWADLVIVATDHTVFKNAKFTAPVIDTRNLFK